MEQLTLVEAGRVEWREAPEPRIAAPGEALVRPRLLGGEALTPDTP
jgi:hypothetical protein